MSTEHVSEHDLEYGPTPEGAKHEHTDIDPGVGYKFAMWLGVSMLISVGIVYGAFRLFEAQESAASRRAVAYPLAAGQHLEPPTPNLQRQPFKDIYELRLGENEKLAAYGWVDKDGGVTRIPIDRAMEDRLAPEGGGERNRHRVPGTRRVAPLAGVGEQRGDPALDRFVRIRSGGGLRVNDPRELGDEPRAVGNGPCLRRVGERRETSGDRNVLDDRLGRAQGYRRREHRAADDEQ